MRDAVPAFTVLATAFLACAGMALSEETPLKATNDNPQMEDEMPKRDWNKDLHIWGKRGWSNFQGGWGRKRSNDDYNPYDKRAWESMHSGWGKRFSPDDSYAIRQYHTMMERAGGEPQFEDYSSEDDLDEAKRAWKNLGGEWGKRSKWENFGPAWGKRDPAWNNLKGIWGKRSADRD